MERGYCFEGGSLAGDGKAGRIGGVQGMPLNQRFSRVDPSKHLEALSSELSSVRRNAGFSARCPFASAAHGCPASFISYSRPVFRYRGTHIRLVGLTPGQAPRPELPGITA